jgi:hypothetical protein
VYIALIQTDTVSGKRELSDFLRQFYSRFVMKNLAIVCEGAILPTLGLVQALLVAFRELEFLLCLGIHLTSAVA